MDLKEGDYLWVQSKLSQSLQKLTTKMSLVMTKFSSDSHYSCCSIQTPVKTTLGKKSTEGEGLSKFTINQFSIDYQLNKHLEHLLAHNPFYVLQTIF